MNTILCQFRPQPLRIPRSRFLLRTQSSSNIWSRTLRAWEKAALLAAREAAPLMGKGAEVSSGQCWDELRWQGSC